MGPKGNFIHIWSSTSTTTTRGQTPLLCTSDTSGLVTDFSPGLCAATATSPDHSVNTDLTGSKTRPTCRFKTREKCIVAGCGCTQGSVSPSTSSWRSQSLDCGWLGSGGSSLGHMPPGQTCGCWTCDPPLCAACPPCHPHPRVSPCHVGATAYNNKDIDLDY